MNRTMVALLASVALAGVVPLVLARAALAQPQAAAKDVVELVDGTRIEGSLVEVKRGSYVVIEGAGGAQQTIPWAKVKNVIRAGDAAPPPAPPPPSASVAPAPSAPAPSSAPATPPAAPPPTPVGSDAVVVKDGTRIAGQVTEQRPGKFVTIKAADGTHTITWDDVRDVIGGPPPSTDAIAPAPTATPAPSASLETPPAPAPAESGPGEPPRWYVSVDRLFGLYAWNVTQSANGGSSTNSGVSVSALVGTVSPDALPAFVFHTPRLSLDYAAGSFTVGGSAGFFVGSSNLNATSGSSNNGGPGLFMYLLEPRVGYLVPLGEHFVFWPRVGVSVFAYSQSTTPVGGSSSTQTDTGFAIDLEPTLAARVGHWGGLTVSGLADIGVGGSTSVTGSSQSISLQSSSYGLTFGMYVAF